MTRQTERDSENMRYIESHPFVAGIAILVLAALVKVGWIK